MNSIGCASAAGVGIRRALAAVLAASVAACMVGEAAPATGGGVEIAYALERPMRVSLNIYDAGGQIVRALLCGAPRSAGRQRELWDGRDGSGRPVPPGRYSWKILAMPGRLKTEFLLTVGTNYPDPQRDAAREAEQYCEVAPGTHGGPTAVAADASGVYVGASCTENIENFLVKTTPDGARRLWSKLHRVAWKGALAMVLSGDRLLVLSTNDGEVWPYAAADGRDLPTIATALPPDDKGGKDDERYPTGIAAAGGEFAVCYPARGIVRWFDAAHGTVVGEVAGLERPTAVAMDADGATYAICGAAVVRLDRAGASRVTVVAGLEKPTRLALGTKGDVFVFEAASQQVLRFSKTGKRLGSMGVAGGRRDGRYDRIAKESFRDVSALAAAPDGGFLVAEPDSAPRRAAWFAADGRLVREWYGGHVWAPWIAVDPEDPGTLFMPSSWNSVMRIEIDYATKSWRVRSVHRIGGAADGLVTGHDNAHLWRAFRRGGTLYLARSHWPWTVLRVDDARDQLVPALVAMPQMRHYWDHQRGPVREWAGAEDNAFVWSDADGDGRPQREEIVFSKADGGWPGLPDWLEAGVHAVRGGGVYRWRITGWNAAGAPLLGEFPGCERLFDLPPRALAGGELEGRWGSYVARDPASGRWYVAVNASMTDWGRSTDSFVIAYDQDGSRRWIAGGRTIGSPQSHLAPGDIGCFRRIAGCTHECVVVNDFCEGEWPLTSYVWDRDGLWVGGVMDEIDRAAAPVWRYGAGGEALGTVLVDDRRAGDVKLFWHGYNDVRIGRVTGWDGWVRLSGTVTLAAAGPASTPRLTAVPPSHGEGLLLEAWDESGGSPDARPSVRRLTDLNEHWGQGRGPDGIRAYDGRMVRVTGEIEAFQTGWHAFAADVYSPKTRYRIAGIELQRHSYNEVKLEAGKRYPVEIVYDPSETHPTTDQGIRITWATPRGTWPGAWSAIPVGQLFAPSK